jgi:hypothetical protein
MQDRLTCTSAQTWFTSHASSLCPIQCLPLIHASMHTCIQLVLITTACCLTRPPRITEVPLYQKTNARLVDPKTGQRLRPGRTRQAAGNKGTISFGAVALTAFVGYRAFQLLWRNFKRKRAPERPPTEDYPELPPVVSGPLILGVEESRYPRHD